MMIGTSSFAISMTASMTTGMAPDLDLPDLDFSSRLALTEQPSANRLRFSLLTTISTSRATLPWSYRLWENLKAARAHAPRRARR